MKDALWSELVWIDPIRADARLVGCSCCSVDKPCRSLRTLWADIEASNAELDRIAALLPEDVEWLVANGWQAPGRRL